MKETPIQGPLILCLESSTMIGSVSIFDRDQQLGHIQYRRAKTHARLMAPMVQTLVQDLELKMQDLAAIAVSKGPGSYTGLRVGVSTAKGLCMALDLPLLSISSLEALAWQVQGLALQLDAKIIPMIDARRMEVYCSCFDGQLAAVEEIQAHILSEVSFRNHLDSGKVIFVGDGVAKAKALLNHPNAIILDEILSSSAGMGKVIFAKYQQELFEDLMTFEPYYLKDFVATKSRDRLRG